MDVYSARLNLGLPHWLYTVYPQIRSGHIEEERLARSRTARSATKPD
ncbi:MAG: hypothetical protein ACI9W4_001537 [Rhodothermales bacterium]|jgi:hypothetical protein